MIHQYKNVRKMAKNSTIDEWKEAILDDNYKSTPVSKIKDYTILSGWLNILSC